MKRIIVSAADAGYYPLLNDLITSIEDSLGGDDVAIGILDVGLSAEQRSALAPRVTHLVTPDWDIPFDGRDAVPQHRRAMTARPYLPRHFPGYDILMWMDADTWIQQWPVVGQFFGEAQNKGLAICQELDRAYANVYYMNNSRQLFMDTMKVFGEATMRHVGLMPMANSGVFAMRSDSHYWAEWAEALTHSLRSAPMHLLSEQTSLNVCIYRRLPLPSFMPAKFNWLCVHAMPMFDTARMKYVELCAPHEEISVIHHTGIGTRIKDAMKVYDMDGKETAMNLSYSQWKEYRARNVR